MQKKILLDGCSFTYGVNLKRQETLEHHFVESGYEVTNLSRPGKSNHAIALDVYNNIDSADIIIVGWTFSSRWHTRYYQKNIDLLATRKNIELPHTLDSDHIEQSYQELHQSFYSLFDTTHWNQVSNMLLDTTNSLALSRNKKNIWFSWEPRAVHSSVYYPHVLNQHRLPCGHLTADGTTHLFNNLTAILEK